MLNNSKVNYLLTVINGLLIATASFVMGRNIAMIFQLTNLTPLVKETLALATTRKPETFTELYFEDHVNLPNEIISGKVYRFSFTIHNLENTDMDYPYEVYVDAQANKEPIDEGTVFVKNDEYKTIDQNYMLATPSGRMKIQVLLVDQNQPISFWMEK